MSDYWMRSGAKPRSPGRMSCRHTFHEQAETCEHLYQTSALCAPQPENIVGSALHNGCQSRPSSVSEIVLASHPPGSVPGVPLNAHDRSKETWPQGGLDVDTNCAIQTCASCVKGRLPNAAGTWREGWGSNERLTGRQLSPEVDASCPCIFSMRSTSRRLAGRCSASHPIG